MTTGHSASRPKRRVWVVSELGADTAGRVSIHKIFSSKAAILFVDLRVPCCESALNVALLTDDNPAAVQEPRNGRFDESSDFFWRGDFVHAEQALHVKITEQNSLKLAGRLFRVRQIENAAAGLFCKIAFERSDSAGRTQGPVSDRKSVV